MARFASPVALGLAFGLWSQCFAATERLPVLMWLYDASVEKVAEYGFTHATCDLLDLRYPAGTNNVRRVERARKELDEAERCGIKLLADTRPDFPVGDGRGAVRKDRRGDTILDRRGKPVPEVGEPGQLKFAEKVSKANLAAYGDHPAFGGTLTGTELRDQSRPSFNHESRRYFRETGRQVPEGCDGRFYPEELAKARFPDGVVPDDDDVLGFYDWWWRKGEGWPAASSAIAAPYRTLVAPRHASFVGGSDSDGTQVVDGRFLTVYDPAVRCPPVWGSGGESSCLNQWVYANPEPLAVAGVAEEVLAMANGRPGQRAMIMTQLLCYRQQLAPTNRMVTVTQPLCDRQQLAPTNRMVKTGVEWVERFPDAAFLSVPPDALREAIWGMLAKPVDAIAFHGWQCVDPEAKANGIGYVCTNPETRDVLTNMLRSVVAPLGPVLKRLGRDEPEVAVFESATTAMLGGPCTLGWNAPAVTFLQRARLDPQVIYEDTIRRDGFGGLRVVYLPQCRYLTRSMVERFREFQRDGGILIADRELTSALKADIIVPVMSFKPPKSDHSKEVNEQVAEIARTYGAGAIHSRTMKAKTDMLAATEKLRGELAVRGYVPRVDSDSGDVIVFNRRAGEARYVFAINDRRTFGDYVGPWGRMMEKGLPNHGRIRVADPEGRIKSVHELSHDVRVPFERKGEGIEFEVDFSTNDGRLFVCLPSSDAERVVVE